MALCEYIFSLLCLSVAVIALFFYIYNPMNLATVKDWRYGLWIAFTFINFMFLGKIIDDYRKMSRIIDEIIER